MGKEKAHLGLVDQVYKEGHIEILTPHGISLELRRDVLVPHPFTYYFIDVAKTYISSHPNIHEIADAGTGSGVIAITLALAFPDLIITATDTNKAALDLAKRNVQINSISNPIHFFLTSESEGWLEPLPETTELILCNPPFLSDPEFFSPESRQRYPEMLLEPESAIRSYDQDGLRHFVKILSAFRQRTQLKALLLEINPETESKLAELLQELELTGKFMLGEDQRSHYLIVERSDQSHGHA